MDWNLEGKTMDDISNTLQQLVQRTESREQDALPALHTYTQQPALAASLGSLSQQVASQLTFYMASGDPAIQAGLLTHFKQITTALVGANCSPIEQLLAEEIALCLLQARYTDTIDARHPPMEQQQQRQERAHQRYLSARRTLAQVQKVLAAKPTVQVNVAQNQINMS
jgi:hypothetical protein